MQVQEGKISKTERQKKGQKGSLTLYRYVSVVIIDQFTKAFKVSLKAHASFGNLHENYASL